MCCWVAMSGDFENSVSSSEALGLYVGFMFTEVFAWIPVFGNKLLTVHLYYFKNN